MLTEPIQNPGYGYPRIYLLGHSVNRGRQLPAALIHRHARSGLRRLINGETLASWVSDAAKLKEP